MADTSTRAVALVSDEDRPRPVDPAAFHGIAGRITKEIEPHTESDPVAIQVQVVTLLGSVMGGRPQFRVEGGTHGTNLFVLVVGESSRARKGTSLKQAEVPIRMAAPDWAKDCKASGLSTGEGLIYAVRDESYKIVDGEEQLADAGVSDKRCAVVETEFASPLKVAGRVGNTLSPVLRNGFDGGTLRVMTRNSPLRATDPHVSILGHITIDELTRELSSTESCNGFGNRFLYVSVFRSKELPDGGEAHLIDWAPIVSELESAFKYADSLTAPLTRNAEARELWKTIYKELTRDRPGMLGSLTARAEAHVTRLALIYAVLDCSPEITADHLWAALALWEYVERSVSHIFGDALGDPVADEILRMLRQAGDEGVTRTQIRDWFGRNKQVGHIERALELIEKLGLATKRKQAGTGGRAAEVWRAT